MESTFELRAIFAETQDGLTVPGNHNERIWGAADELQANSKLKASEYSLPVLRLIILKYADFKFRPGRTGT